MARGDNCTLIATNYGSIRVRARSLAYGMRVVFDEDQARFSRVMYVNQRTTAPFVLGLIFSTHADYEEFANWLRGYGSKIANPDSTTAVSLMRVIIPARNFDKSGVPVDGITFGAQAEAVTYSMFVQFTGVRESGESVNLGQSRFIGADANISPEAPYFYPAGQQLKGSASGADWLYDNPLAAPMAMPAPDPRDNPNFRPLKGPF